ncbi:MAG: peptidylprolyl isomerase, partial [candidate division KSB1 bacterium]|nr:peptidylprolyl isomerase [candidate division KSB1 bacterium]
MFLLSMTIGGLVGGADITHLFTRRPDTVLTVNGQNVSIEQYNERRQQYFEYYRQQNKKEPEGFELQRLEDELFESYVREILVQQFAEKAKIGVTSKEVHYYMFDDPSVYLASSPYFRDEKGNFDLKTYKEVMKDGRYLPLFSQLEEDLKRSIPFNKINQQILTSVFVTDEEARTEFARRNQTIKVKYVSFNPAEFKIADNEIKQDELKKYYDEHKENFKEEETRKIQYVLFPLIPSANDTSDALFNAEALLDSIRQGIDFAYLAQTYSDDPGSAQKGGDLDYFERGVMVKPFEDAAFSAAIGEVVGPIISQHGIHIIKVEDRKVEDGKEKVRARHILLRINPSRSTSELAADDANNFIENAKKEGFVAAAAAVKMNVDTTNFFDKRGVIPGLGLQKILAEDIFHAKIGKVSRRHYIENRGYIVYQLLEIKKARMKPFNEVEQIVKNAVIREKQKQRAEQAAQQFRAKIQQPMDFETQAEASSLQILETDFFTLEGYGRNVPQDPNFKGAAFGLEVDEVSPVVRGNRGVWVIKMIEKTDFDASAFAAQKENIKNELLQRKQRAALEDWYENLKKEAKIRDYRYLFL